MPAHNGRARHERHSDPTPVHSPGTPLEAFVAPLWSQTIPLGDHFSYLVAGVKFQEDDLKDYLEEPIAALPPVILAQIPRVHVVLVPFIEIKGEAHFVTETRPPGEKQVAFARLDGGENSMMLFAMQEPNLGDFHYYFFRGVSKLAAEAASPAALDRFYDLLVDELNQPVHGEVDEEGWRLKQDLFERSGKVKKSSKGFAQYAASAFADTMTLYLHGLCCDIDVEPGPRQLPSRPLRRRLKVLEDLYPPPGGYTVFPDDK
jgi:hypothetical protein